MAGGRLAIWGTLIGCILMAPGCMTSPLGKKKPAGAVQPVAFEEVDDASPGDSASASSPLGTMVAKVTGGVSDPKAARAAYREAEATYAEALEARRSGDDGRAKARFLAAAEQFQAAAEAWPDSAVEEDSWLRAGESFFFASHFGDANEAYEQLVAKHPDSRYLDFVQARRLAIAQFWLKSNRADPLSWYEVNLLDPMRPTYDWKGNAFRILKKIPMDDPTGKYADEAILAHANALFIDGKYDQADQLYDDLRTLYPTSEHQFTAHLMGVKSKLLRYQGPEYGGDELDDAQKLIERIQVQFPQEAAGNRDLLTRARREIRYRKAEREWFMAKYYDRRGEYRAAAFYYNLLQKDYEDTPFAGKAQGRIGEIAEKPPVPPQRLAWLVRLFPDRQPAKPILKTDSTVRR